MGGCGWCWLAIAAAVAGPAGAGTLTAKVGNVPEGLWVLNLARSRPMVVSASQVMWMLKDNGKQMVWVAAITDAKGMVQVNSWDGPYDGAAVGVIGTTMSSQLTSRTPGTVHNFGIIAGAGSYVEDCEVSEGGKRFVCHGKLTTPQGEQDWLEDYDWVGPSPR
jgi:hypothetical protein